MLALKTLSMSLRLPYASRSIPFQSLPCLLNLKQSNSRISFSAGSRTVPTAIIRASTFPARDLIINFGKHKGKMLGAIPSGYLKWVSENVSSEWAKLANQVLEDPIYQDRVEWEFADNILSGDKVVRNLDAVEELHDIAERFGWDFDDKEGWGKVKFPLLGTSKSGKIPRISDRPNRTSEKTKKKTEKVAAKELVGGERRRDRIERQRTKRETGKLQDKKMELGIEPRISATAIGEKSRPRFAPRKDPAAAAAQPPKTRLARTDEDYHHYRQDRTAEKTRNPFQPPKTRLARTDDKDDHNYRQDRTAETSRSPFLGREAAAAAQPPKTKLALSDGEDDRTAEKTRNPFPGREAFLEKVLRRQKSL